MPTRCSPTRSRLVEAARILTDDGFQVFPYTTEDVVLADRLLEAGCEVLMPWGAPIGTGLGLTNIYGLRTLRAQFPEVPMVVDAGLGLPSQAAHGDGDGLRRGPAEHRRRQGRRPGGDGRRFRPRHRGRAAGLCRRPDGAARHGRALDPGDREGVPDMSDVMELDRFYPIFDSLDWLDRYRCRWA